MRSIIQRYRVDRRHIAYMRFIIEAYEGLAVMSTVDSQRAIIELKIAPGCLAEVNQIISELKSEFLVEID